MIRLVAALSAGALLVGCASPTPEPAPAPAPAPAVDGLPTDNRPAGTSDTVVGDVPLDAERFVLDEMLDGTSRAFSRVSTSPGGLLHLPYGMSVTVEGWHVADEMLGDDGKLYVAPDGYQLLHVRVRADTGSRLARDLGGIRIDPGGTLPMGHIDVHDGLLLHSDAVAWTGRVATDDPTLHVSLADGTEVLFDVKGQTEPEFLGTSIRPVGVALAQEPVVLPGVYTPWQYQPVVEQVTVSPWHPDFGWTEPGFVWAVVEMARHRFGAYGQCSITPASSEYGRVVDVDGTLVVEGAARHSDNSTAFLVPNLRGESLWVELTPTLLFDCRGELIDHRIEGVTFEVRIP